MSPQFKKSFVYDKGPEDKPVEIKNIVMSVFFDGTQNNKTNTENEVKSIPQREFFMDSDVRRYDDFIHPKPEIEEEITKPATGPIYVAKENLKTVVVKGYTRESDSYENDFTNVARLWKAYVEKTGQQEKIYIEGAGTEDNQPDDQAAVATGVFLASIRVKARDACDKIVDRLNLRGLKKLDTLTVDVFGFSRGATTARYFTHFITCTDTKKEVSKYYENHATPKEIKDLFLEVQESCKKNFDFMKNDELSLFKKAEAIPYAIDVAVHDLKPLLAKVVEVIRKAYRDETHAYFQQRIKDEGFVIKNIAVRFVGLYDSVSSYGLFFDNDVNDLGLTAVNKARKVVHLSAADEYRKNFALTNVVSTGFKGVALSLPGVHSDVGGSYNRVEYEKTAFYIMAMSLSNKLTTTLTHDTYQFLENLTEPAEITSFKRKLIREGWLKPNQCKPEYHWWLNKDNLQSIVLTGILQKILTRISWSPLAPPIIKEINDKLLKAAAIGLPPFGILYGHRKLYQGYSFIPLYLMSDFALEMGVPIKKSVFGDNGWIVPSDLKTIEDGIRKYSETVVDLRKELMEESQKEKVERKSRDGKVEHFFGAIEDVFTSDKQEKYLRKSKKISYMDFIKKEDLHYLRNNYLHWSSKSDTFGYDPNTRSVDYEGTRQVYEG